MMKIAGIGNALLDVLLRLESDTVLQKMGVTKGAMDLIDEPTMRALQQAHAGLKRTEVAGGSACNTMRAMARLGAEVGYIGKIGDDAIGKVYAASAKEAGVKPFFARTQGISGCSTILVSPDGERTMATFLGPAATLSAAEIPDETLRPYDALYLEGYLVTNEALFLPILERAKKLGLKIALDLSNFNIVHGFKSLLREVVPACVDILFANESEAEAYTGLPAREAVEAITGEVEIAVVTLGKDGALVGRRDGPPIHERALEGRQVVDTTGAGDHFAAGFLYGYTQGATLEQSARVGSLLAGHVIEVVGPQIAVESWEQIKLKVYEALGK
jgi:sugar/nucleoside kinase (ribokinase family)